VQLLIPNFTNITIIHEYVVNGGDAATNYTHTLNGGNAATEQYSGVLSGGSANSFLDGDFGGKYYVTLTHTATNQSISFTRPCELVELNEIHLWVKVWFDDYPPLGQYKLQFMQTGVDEPLFLGLIAIVKNAETLPTYTVNNELNQYQING
jgi:hypothetical protein